MSLLSSSAELWFFHRNERSAFALVLNRTNRVRNSVKTQIFTTEPEGESASSAELFVQNAKLDVYEIQKLVYVVSLFEMPEIAEGDAKLQIGLSGKVATSLLVFVVK